MWISKKKYRQLEKRIADLEVQVQGQQIVGEIISEFCCSVANKEKMDLLSYQQLHSPSANSNEKVRMLLQKIRKLG